MDGCGEEEPEECCEADFEPLPALLEDEENVSLADILALRESCLTEQDIWAICVECCFSLKSISTSALFQTLCITPDTLAFNTSGNVCFMEQISDEPEDEFVPPEFEITGNTFEAHIFSLGATLQAAVEYVVDPELELDICRDLLSLLDQMQDEDPSSRPDIETIISQCEERMNYCSSLNICRSLSAIGRRVLSIESVAAFHDGCESSWKAFKTGLGTKLLPQEKILTGVSAASADWRADSRCSSCLNNFTEKNTQHGCDFKESQMENGDGRVFHMQSANKLERTKMDSTGIRNATCLETESNMDEDQLYVENSCAATLLGTTQCERHDRGDSRQHTLKTSCKNCGTETMSCRMDLSPTTGFQNDIEKSCVLESQKEPSEAGNLNLTMDDTHKRSCVGEHLASTVGEQHLSSVNEFPAACGCMGMAPADNGVLAAYSGALVDSFETLPLPKNNSALQLNAKTLPLETKPKRIQHGASDSSDPEGIHSPSALEEDSCGKEGISEATSEPEQWTSLKDLLSWHGKALKEYELWALCHECLFTLQSYVEFPGYLCFDSVFVGSHGEILFVAPKEKGSYDTFCVAPEYEEQRCVTEKGCVYGVAAILWTAAKTNCPVEEKLTLPKKLKRLLLNMAKRDYMERPSLADALKMCTDYLLQQNLSSRDLMAQLSTHARQAHRHKTESPRDAIELEKESGVNLASKSNLGFVPLFSEKKLTAVMGPVPRQILSNGDTPALPVTFTSPASYFKPIILMQNIEKSRDEGVDEAPSSVLAPDHGIIGSKSGLIVLNDIENHALADQAANTPNGTKIRKGALAKSVPISFERQSFNPSASSTTHSASTSDYVSDLKENASSATSSNSSASLTLPTSPLVNNFLLKQDPKTGILKLVPVQLGVPDEVPSVPLKTESTCACLCKAHVLLSVPSDNEEVSVTIQQHTCDQQINMTWQIPGELQAIQSTVSKEMPNVPLDYRIGNSQDSTEHKKEVDSSSSLSCRLPYASADTQTMAFTDLEATSLPKRTISSPLQKVVQCIQEEFAFDGYLENGVEDLVMGEYIFSLKGLQFGTFCDAVSEKFCDLYWDDRLLQTLYTEVNGKSPPLLTTVKDDAVFNRSSRSFRKKRPGKKLKQETMLEKPACNPNENSMNSEELPYTQNESAREPSLRSMADEENHVGINLAGGEKSPSVGDLTQGPITGVSVNGLDVNSFDSFEEDVSDLTREAGMKIEELSVDSPFQLSTSSSLDPDLNLNDEDDEEEEAVDNAVGNRNAMSPIPSDISNCCPGWRSAFYGTRCFNSTVQQYMQNLGRHRKSGPSGLESKRLELEQQLMFETKNYKKTVNFYQKLLQKDAKNRGSEVKTKLSKLKEQLEEMKSKVQFLELVKKCIQVTNAEQWGLEISALPTIACITTERDRRDLSPSDESSLLVFYNIKEWQSDTPVTSRILQAGTPLGLMSYLYCSKALSEGYVQQFLYTFRYFCTQDTFLQFLIDRLDFSLSSENLDPSSVHIRIYNRSLYILRSWIEDCFYVDFLPNTNLLDKLEEYLSHKIIPYDILGEHLLSLLQDLTSQKDSSVSPGSSLGERSADDETKSFHSICNKVLEDTVSRKSFSWKTPKVNGPLAVHQRQHSIASALPRPCYAGYIEEFSGIYVKAEERGPYFFNDFTVQQLSQQLTLLQEEVFQHCHPVNFLNSRALGVGDNPTIVPKCLGTESLMTDGCSLFLPNCTQNKSLLHILRFAETVSTWVASEIVTTPTPKLQASLLSTFLQIAKSCYEQRDFATAMQVLGGLENLIIRQLPAWKSLPSKVSEILDELKAAEVFLKSDNLCLMAGDRFKTLPTIPSAHVLAMHIQQLETGGFTLTSGAYKWSKLRNIAKVVSQVQAFQQIPYAFAPDPDLQFYLKQRINSFSDADISALATNNNINFHQPTADKHSRKIQDALRKMKANFQ